MNSKQRRQHRKELYRRIGKHLSILKCQSTITSELKEETVTLTLKDFNIPNIQGQKFVPDNLNTVIEDLKTRLPLYCELEPFNAGGQVNDNPFRDTFQVVLNNSVARIESVDYDKETNTLKGVVTSIKSVNYPGYTTLVKDIKEGKAFFGVRGIGETINTDTIRLVKIFTLDVHFNPCRLPSTQ